MKQGDTITFSSKYNDEFGEFGGPLQKVYLTLKEDKIWVHYYKQRAFLFFYFMGRVCYTTKSKPLSVNSKNVIYKAINEFNKQLFYESQMKINGYLTYRIRTNKNNEQLMCLTSKKWNGFKRMRRKIFPIGFSFRLKLTKEMLVQRTRRKF